MPNEMCTMGVITEGPYFSRQPAALNLTGHVNMTAGSAAVTVIPTCRILGIHKLSNCSTIHCFQYTFFTLYIYIYTHTHTHTLALISIGSVNALDFANKLNISSFKV